VLFKVEKSSEIMDSFPAAFREGLNWVSSEFIGWRVNTTRGGYCERLPCASFCCVAQLLLLRKKPDRTYVPRILQRQ
jgi:hypothetical protein